MTTPVCPRCDGERLLKGTCGARQQIGYGFAPDEVRHGWFDWNPLIVPPVESGSTSVTACADCGLVWFDISPRALGKLIDRNGTEAGKQILSLPSKLQPPRI